MSIAPEPLVVWRLCDAKPGHENQTLGLVAALRRLLEVRAFDIRVAGASLRALARIARGLPTPALIIGAGRQCHLPVLLLRWRNGGRTIVLMKPSLPLALFNLCLIPEHDGVGPRENVILTRGVLNDIRPALGRQAGLGLILLGGPSRHHHWEEEAVLQRVRNLLAGGTAFEWRIFDSRRTPASTRQCLGSLTCGRYTYRRYEDTPAPRLADNLAQADTVWVSEDSVSMVYEALTGGARVGLLPLARTGSSRVASGIDRLVAEGLVTRYEDWLRHGALAAQRVPLAEAERCARRVVQHWPDLLNPIPSLARTARKPTISVLQVLPALDGGGVERGTVEVAAALVRRGHRALVVSAPGRMVADLRDAGAEHVPWAVGVKSPVVLRHVLPLRRLLREQSIDILHARSRLPAWLAYLVWRSLPRRARPRFVTTVHGLHSVNPYSAIMVRGERIIAISETVRGYITVHYPWVDPDRIHVIPRGIDPALYHHGFQPSADWQSRWQAEYPATSDHIVCTLPARISPRKGQADFIALLAALRARGLPVLGLVVGGGDCGKARWLAELRAEAARRGIERHVVFTGHRSDLREIMARSRIVFCLSRLPEAFGRTALEALSLGVPCIAYEHGGSREVLGRMFPHGLTPPGDADALVSKTLDILGQAPPVRPQAPFTLQDMLDRTIALYESLVEG
ncbi:MAG: ELM1/GtrOC1 family putative glycosyltransferase [Gammaproteobacteria bacterium]